MRLFALALLGLAGCSRPQGPVIFAASSLREVLAGLDADVRFEASSTLARQIKAGAAADVFITAAPEWLDGLNALETFEWLRNRLVCIVPRDVEDFDIAKAASLAMAGEQVPAGKYARAALQYLKIPLPGRVIYGSNVRDVLSKVSQGGAACGIVYATDAAVDPEVRIAFTFPEESHPPIVYSVAVLTEKGRAVATGIKSRGFK